jgi:hypothetical protein
MRSKTFSDLPKAWRGNHNHLAEWVADFTADGTKLPATDTELFLRYMDDGMGLQQLLAGKGTVYSQEMVRMATGAKTAGWGKFVESMKDFRNGVVDDTFIRELGEVADDMGVGLDFDKMLPRNVMDEFVDKEFLVKSFDDLSEEVTGAYQAGRVIAGSVSRVPGAQSLGRLIAGISTMVPANSNIALLDSLKAGDNAVQNASVDIPRFIETMGVHFNIPSGVRREWLDATMRTGTVSQRRQVLTSFMDSVFEIGGMKSTAAGQDLVNTYVKKWKQAYGGGTADVINVNGIDRVVGHLPDHHNSVFMVMPDLREMSDAVRRGHLLKSVAKFTDSDFVESSMSRYIKPGWLLRIGFIPRAGGEELLAFLARMTSGGLIQEFGGRSIAMGEAADLATAARRTIIETGKGSLDKAQLAALRWQTPSHMRPLELIGERVGWLSPEKNFLDDYGQWLRASMTSGLLGPEAFRGMPGALDNIMLGRSNSVRRMLINGVEPGTVMAGRKWVARHEKAVLAATSAKNASLAEKAIVRPDTALVSMSDPDGAGEYRDVEMLLTGERGVAGRNDPRYKNGVHSSATEVYQDGIIGPIFADHQSRLLQDGVIKLTPYEVAGTLEAVGQVENWTAQKLLLELVDQREDSLRAFGQVIDRDMPEVADAIAMAIVDGELDTIALRAGIDNAIEAAEDVYDIAPWQLKEMNALRDSLDSVDNVMARLNELDMQERQWLGMSISRQIVGGDAPLDPAAIRAMGDGLANPSPQFKLYRGVQDGTTYRVREDGALVMTAGRQQQYDFADGAAVSFTTDPSEARGYAGAGTQSGESGVVFEIDGMSVADQFGTNVEEMGRTPLMGGSEALERGDGPYYYSHGIDTGDFTEVAVVFGNSKGQVRELVIPKGKWRTQDTDQMAEIARASFQMVTPPFDEIAGIPFDDAIRHADGAIDDFIADLSAAEKIDLVRYYRDRVDGVTEFPSSVQDKFDALEVEARFDDILGNSAAFDPAMFETTIAARIGIIDSEITNVVGEPTSGDTFRSLVEGVRSRGQGAFDYDATQQYSPLFTDLTSMRESAINEATGALLSPQNADALRGSDRMLQMPDGSPIMQPADSGMARIYSPVVPQNTTKLQAVLDGVDAGLDAQTMTAKSLVGVMEAALSTGETSYIEAAVLAYLDSAIPELRAPAERMARILDEAAAGGVLDMDGLVREFATIRAGVNIDETYIQMAQRLMQQGNRTQSDVSSIAYLDDEERLQLLANVLEEIDNSRAKYMQPISLSVDTMAFSDPRVARWVTHMLDDGLGAALPTSVGMMTVPRRATTGKGDFTSGIRRRGGQDGSEVWKLDNRWLNQAEPMDARRIRVTKSDSINPVTKRPTTVADYQIGATIYEAARATATIAVDNSLAVQKRGVRLSLRLKDELGGRVITRVKNDEMVPLEPGEKLNDVEELFELDAKGRATRSVTYGDRTLFDADSSAGRDDLMWNIISGPVRDHYESARGLAVTVPKSLVGKNHLPGVKYEPDQLVRMSRSRVTDVGRELADDLPTTVMAQNYKAMKDRLWDRMVRWGFDKVIGPSIDAIVRKPMSFHYYNAAFQENRRKLGWLLDTEVFDKRIPAELAEARAWLDEAETVTDLQMQGANIVQRELKLESVGDPLKSVYAAGADDADVIAQAKLVQRNMVARERAALRTGIPSEIKGDKAATSKWVDQQVDEYLGADLAAIDELIVRTRRNIAGNSYAPLGIADETGSQRLVNIYNEMVPDEVWSGGYESFLNHLNDGELGLYSNFTDDQFQLLRRARNNLVDAVDRADEGAAMRAIENVVPFLDSHEERSMFAEYGRNFIPFWYAEENFIKRWSRTLAVSDAFGLDTIRKGQLTYMGLRSAGVVRTDDNGTDWVVYPGSGLLVEAVSKIMPKGGAEPIGVLFQANTESLLPGVNSEFGGAAPSPFIALPVTMVSALFPDSKELKRALLGDIGASRSSVSQFVPGTLGKAWEVFFQNEDSSTRYASAMNAAIAYNEASGNGLPDDATPKQADDYLDRMRNHARIIMVSQMLAGFVSPGAPSTIETGQSQTSWEALSGVGIEDPAQVTSTMYRQYVTNLGIEAGTEAFLEAFPLADLEDVVNPLAFTTSKSESESRAPLPATAIGMAWYNEHRDWIDASPEAGAWFLPQDKASDEFDYYSYSQQLASGLRKQRSPDEYLRAIKTRSGASVYFAAKDQYDEQVELAGNDQQWKRNADAIWGQWSSEFLAANPIFAEELQSGESRQRRARTREQLRYAVDDPAAPPSPYTDGIRRMVRAYDTYSAELRVLSQRRDAQSLEEKRQLKTNFEAWVDAWKLRNVDLARLWSTVYQPDATLS